MYNRQIFVKICKTSGIPENLGQSCSIGACNGGPSSKLPFKASDGQETYSFSSCRLRSPFRWSKRKWKALFARLKYFWEDRGNMFWNGGRMD